MYLFIATRETTPVEVLAPSSLVKKRDERAPEQLRSSRLQLAVFFCSRSESEIAVTQHITACCSM
jgi:hypothetical protein